MSRPSTRESAIAETRKPNRQLTLDPDARGLGLREWLSSLPALHTKAAAFDTRIDMSSVLTGRAAKGIARLLHQHGLELAAEPESFLVTKQQRLVPGETERAQRWARQLADNLAAQRTCGR
jgi:hypothetical protein